MHYDHPQHPPPTSGDAAAQVTGTDYFFNDGIFVLLGPPFTAVSCQLGALGQSGRPADQLQRV